MSSESSPIVPYWHIWTDADGIRHQSPSELTEFQKTSIQSAATPQWIGAQTRHNATAYARYTGYRFPAEIIGHAVWLYFRFPLGLPMVEELLAARGIIVSHETMRRWALKFGQHFANQIRRRLPRVGDKWHLDEVVLKIAGVKHWLWRAVDQAAGCTAGRITRKSSWQGLVAKPSSIARSP